MLLQAAVLLLAGMGVSADSSNMQVFASSNSLEIKWTAVAGASNTSRYWYRIRTPVMGPWMNQTQTSVIIRNLTSATTYTIQFQYCQTQKTGCTTAETITARTFPNSTEPADLDKSLPNITSISFTSTNAKNLTIRFDPSITSAITGYRISWCPTGDCLTKVMTTVEKNDYMITNLTADTSYTITMQTANGNYFGLPNSTMQMTRIGSMMAVVLPASSTSLVVGWPAMPSFNSNSTYKVQRVGEQWLSTNATHLEFNSLTANTLYTFQTQFCRQITYCSAIESVSGSTASATKTGP